MDPLLKGVGWPLAGYNQRYKSIIKYFGRRWSIHWNV